MNIKAIVLYKAIRRKCLLCKSNSWFAIRECPSHDCPLYPYRFGRKDDIQEQIEVTSIYAIAHVLGYFASGNTWTIHKPGQGFSLLAETSDGDLKTIRSWSEKEYVGSPAVFNTYIRKVLGDYVPFPKPIPITTLDLRTLQETEANNKNNRQNLADFADK